MKNIAAELAWGLGRIGKAFGNLLSAGVRLCCPVVKGRVMCWSYNFKQYSCNPRYLTEYLLENDPDFEIYWVFRKSINTRDLDPRIRQVRFRSWRYFLLVNTAQFLVTNARTDPYKIYWRKRPGQRYLMLWHGGVALKKIEQDAEGVLSLSYLKKARLDSKVCDLMISGCRFQTELVKNRFWYGGEVLQEGIPRNDIFFKSQLHVPMREKVGRQYGIAQQEKLVLYAPTFRTDHSLEPYRIDWQRVIPELERFFDGSPVTVLLRMHPLLIGKADVSSLINHPKVMDVTRYHDMQELLCISDLLITDYSSSMFDYSMTLKPCLLYAVDRHAYDRGFYFDMKKLPYPLAETEEELISAIRSFDLSQYRSSLANFFDREVGLMEAGHACASLSEWMRSHD